MFEDKGIGLGAARESRTPTSLRTKALKASVSAIPPPRLIHCYFTENRNIIQG